MNRIKGDEVIGTYCEKCRQVMCKCYEWEKTLNDFKENFLKNQKDIDSEIAEIINKNFKDLLY